jgi:predicted translin family RNA/ssDNA-binding protein
MPVVPTKKPSLPLRYREYQSNDNNDPAILLQPVSAQVVTDYRLRQEAYDTSRLMQIDLARIQSQIGTPQAAQDLRQFQHTYSDYVGRNNHPNDDDTANETTLNVCDRSVRMANLSDRIEDYVRLSAYQYFLETGTLLPPVEYATDEEYLAGALMGLARELQQYGLGRATVRDVDSVQMACDLVASILEFLLQLDFRNGPLRRKYDGTKYSLKALETLLYELAITAPKTNNTNMEDDDRKAVNEPTLKRIKPEVGIKTELLLPLDALQALKGRMEHRDELRETLIKRARDGQKAAKQSIFALHRGDRNKAMDLLQQCSKCIREDLWPIVQEEPPLREGSFTNVLEEYVEAKLFAVWLYGRNNNDNPVDSGTTNSHGDGIVPSTVLMGPEEFTADIVELDAEEYIGGLCDLTGEIGRFAVQRGTARDLEGVKKCLQANSGIYEALKLMENVPGQRSWKKLAQVKMNVEKLERMLYEMSLSEAAGGRDVHTDVGGMELEAEEQ